MSDRLSKRAQLLAEILRYINDGNYEKAGEAWSFGKDVMELHTWTPAPTRSLR